MEKEQRQGRETGSRKRRNESDNVGQVAQQILLQGVEDEDRGALRRGGGNGNVSHCPIQQIDVTLLPD